MFILNYWVLVTSGSQPLNPKESGTKWFTTTEGGSCNSQVKSQYFTFMCVIYSIFPRIDDLETK